MLPRSFLGILIREWGLGTSLPDPAVRRMSVANVMVKGCVFSIAASLLEGTPCDLAVAARLEATPCARLRCMHEMKGKEVT